MDTETWYLKVGRVNGEWDYSVSGIANWSDKDMVEFFAMCHKALQSAHDMNRQNTKAFKAVQEAIRKNKGLE